MSEPARTVYVSNGRGGTVTPIAAAASTPGPPIPVGRGPGLIVITPDGKTAYVTSDESIVVPIDTATGTPRSPIAVGVNRPGLHDQPDGIAVTPDGKTVYVASIGSGTVTPIDTATNTPGEPIDVGSEPFAITVTPDGKTVYVANTWETTGRPAGTPGTVTPIATATNTPGAPIEVGSQPWAFAITPDGKTAYVINFAQLR